MRTLLYNKFLLLIVAMFCFITANIFAQGLTEYTPYGKPIKSTELVKVSDGKTFLADVDGSGDAEIADMNDIRNAEITLPPAVWKEVWSRVVSDPFEIIRIAQKASKAITCYMLRNDDEILTVTRNTVNNDWMLQKPITINFIDKKLERCLKILGDKLYLLTTKYVYASSDSGATWQLDTLGLGGPSVVKDIALDTSQNVFVATTKGLYMQAGNSDVWIKNSSFPISSQLNSIFIDRQNRIFVSSNSNGVFRSTDGLNWLHDTTTIGMTQIKTFTDDVYGNIYALTSSGAQLFRSNDVGLTWSRIESPIMNLSADQSRINLINDIKGDSLIVASTAFGLFLSTNQGTTWIHASHGHKAKQLYGFLKLPNGRFLSSTDLGFYFRERNDSTWMKTYPQTGFIQGSPIWRDNSGSITTLTYRHDFLAPPTNVMQSNDDGLTWVSDTTGISKISFRSAFYVDEFGTQYLSSMGTLNGPALLFSKKRGNSWMLDTAGFKTTAQYDKGLSYASDFHGMIYHCGEYAGVKVWRRPINGGTWIADTIGLSNDTLTIMASDRNGNMIAASNRIGLYHHINNVWSNISPPVNLSSATVTAISVDSTNVLITAFSLDGIPQGVYYTKDEGATWIPAGVDTALVSSLVSYGDTTYALTKHGVFVLNTSVTTRPKLQLSTTSLSFGDVKLGYFKDTVFTLTNIGTDTLRITDITSNNPALTIRINSKTIPPNQSFVDTIRFTPVSLGNIFDSIKIMSNALSSPDVISVSGKGRGIGILKLSTNVISFGQIKNNQWYQDSLTMTNIGTDTLTIIHIDPLTGNEYAIPSSATIAPSQSITIVIRFVALDIGLHSAQLKVRSDSPTSPDTIVIMYNANGEPKLQLSQKDVSFGIVKIGQSKELPFTITNTGDDTLHISNITSNHPAFTTTQSQAIIVRTYSFTDTVRFSPSSVGTFSGMMFITGNALTSPDTIFVSGIGEQPTNVETNNSLPGYIISNHPNPFRATTSISFSIPHTSFITIKVYNIFGEEMMTLLNESREAGEHSLSFNGMNLPNGVYYYRLIINDQSSFPQPRVMQIKKMLLLH